MAVCFQHRTGLFPEHAGIAPIAFDDVRLTIPAREALEAAGARVSVQATLSGGQVYRVELGARMPTDLVAARMREHYGPAVRLAIEPEWPGEYPDCWTALDWTPCPECGAPLVWYEAGYVPGYRVCSRPPHHHVR